ncbi:hypothetical protein GTY60_01460 [Streptomyces sp. SID8367]|nr:hypothetical protein [Streptomyces sp. SID8367]
MIGKFADWKIPFGPFNAVQIAVMSLGGLLLVKSASVWWSFTGPVPVVAWLAVIFVCRRHKVAGRTPVGSALGVVARAMQPAGGRTGGRAARDRRPQPLTGVFTLQDLTPPAGKVPVPAAAAPHRASRTERQPRPSAERPVTKRTAAAPAIAPATVRRSLSPVQAALLAAKEQS